MAFKINGWGGVLRPLCQEHAPSLCWDEGAQPPFAAFTATASGLPVKIL